MSEDNKTKFGNMPLGMINKMLVSFIGEDAFLDYCEKYHKDWKLDWQSREAFRKHLDRLFEEKESSYRDLNPHYEQSVYRIAFKILDDFCEQYGLPRYIADTILTFYGFHTLLTFQLSQAEYPICETHYMLDYVICGILHSFVKRTVNEIGKKDDICFSYLDAKEKYEKTFQELGKKFKDKNGEKSSLEKFYTKLSEHLWDSPTSTWYKDWYKESYKQRYEKRYKEMHKEKWKKKLDEKINNKLDWKDCLRLHFKDIVIYNCKKGQNPTQWNDMKAILEFCKKEDKKTEMSCLIEAYLTANVQNFIKDKIPESDWKKIKSCFESIGKNVFNKFINEEKNSGNTTYLKEDCLFLAGELLKMLHRILLDPLRDKSEPIRLARSEILEKHIYLQDEKKAEDLISNIEKIAPEASGFYCNWLRAYIAVAKGEFEKAKELYKAAFDNIHFAGIWTEPFLKQAFALSVFCDSNPDTVRNSIDPEKDSKTPLPKDAKRFAEYGYAIGVFDKPAEDAFLEYVYRKENFSAEFPEDMFFPGKEINSDRIKPENFVFWIEKEEIEKYYNILSALKEGDINTRLAIIINDDCLRLPQLSMAIWLFIISSDEKFLDLIEGWLGFSDPEVAIKDLKFNILSDLGKTPFNASETAIHHFFPTWFSDLGETPLNAATMAYKDFCTKNSDPESPVKKRLQKITTRIFDKTDKEYRGIATGRRGIHPLQNVIASCDIDLVKKFVEGGLDIDESRLESDKVSPVYYTINRIIKLQYPKAHGNTNFEYLDAQGINGEDRKKNYYKTMNNLSPEIQEIITEYVIKDEFGDESTYGEQREKLKEICLYLIDHTKDQDAYKFRNKDGAEWTSLTLAAETDDADICRALLKQGADPNISLKTVLGNEIPKTCSEIQTTFLHRCIQHEAWNVLEMFLKEFKDEASKTIKEYNNEPFFFFFEKNKEKREGFMKKFIELFESCGADFTINSTDELKKQP